MNATASKSDKCAMKKMKEPDLIELLEVRGGGAGTRDVMHCYGREGLSLK